MITCSPTPGAPVSLKSIDLLLAKENVATPSHCCCCFQLYVFQIGLCYSDSNRKVAADCCRCTATGGK